MLTVLTVLTKELANETSTQELFWVIKNGINMTGMPSFGAVEVPDQEIWTIVAFVPTVSDDDFKAWTGRVRMPPCSRWTRKAQTRTSAASGSHPIIAAALRQNSGR